MIQIVKIKQKKIIARAAKLCAINISQFVLKEAYESAQQILSEEAHFKLPDKQWHSFCAALDKPPKSIEAVRQLLIEPSVFKSQ